VWDSEGRRYLDFVAGFGVAALGHAHPRVVAAVARQARRLIHGYGDVHPHELRARLASRLAAIAPWPRARVLWAQNGSEAVELAWKTAYRVTGRPGVLAFEGGFHGQSLGALAVTGWPRSRRAFRGLLARHAVWGPYAYCARCPLGLEFPSCRFACVREAFARADRFAARGAGVGAVLVEPVQGRGGEIVPPPGYLAVVHREARRRGWLLIDDEIYTGLGRTGRRFACEHDAAVPDMILVGKALGGGLPIAAVLGRGPVLEAWRAIDSGAEAPHSATFLASPLACAAALATLEVLRVQRLSARAARLGKLLLAGLRKIAAGRSRVLEVRGRGMLAGLELTDATGAPDAAAAGHVMTAALAERLLVLTGGMHGNVVSLSPPITLSQNLLATGVRRLGRALDRAIGGPLPAGDAPRPTRVARFQTRRVQERRT
jgi:4-aminobutyrate aminotransferase-like enzyme